MGLISVVVPVFNEQESIPIFLERVSEVMANELPKWDFEFWFIDDGSTDNTAKDLEKLASEQVNIHFVEFSRNFGKEAGLYAGLQHASGDLVAVMDVDLQDPPALLPEMVADVASGEWDSVGARRTTRAGEPVIRTLFSKAFYKLINKISDTQIVEGARDYRVMNRTMVDAILAMTEYNRFSKGIFTWVGFKQKYLEYENVDRVAGKTSWSFWQLFKYSVEGIIAFSETPLVMVSVFGIISFVLSIIGVIALVIRALVMTESAVAGWASMIVVILFIGGIQLLSLGIVGRYISGIYLEVKKRPIYIARKMG